MSTDETVFFEKCPEMLPVYVCLKGKLAERYPEMTVRVSKSQISFRNRHIFAMASLPMRRGKGWPEKYLLVSFGLGARRVSPRIVHAIEPYPGRWTHHVPVCGPGDLDGELMGWLDESYRFSMLK